MTTRITPRKVRPRPQIAPAFATRRPSWPAPRELFGESFPELLLVVAVVAALVSAVLALNGTS